MFYKQVNRMRDGFQTKPLSCWSTDGDILSDKADILNRRKEYFQNLYDMTQDKFKGSYQGGQGSQRAVAPDKKLATFIY
jgi:hypothetical protein